MVNCTFAFCLMVYLAGSASNGSTPSFLKASYWLWSKPILFYFRRLLHLEFICQSLLEQHERDNPWYKNGLRLKLWDESNHLAIPLIPILHNYLTPANFSPHCPSLWCRGLSPFYCCTNGKTLHSIWIDLAKHLCLRAHN